MPPKPQKGFRENDFRIGAAIIVALAFYYVLTSFISGADNYVNLCILTICAAFLADMSTELTWKSGLTRLTVTGIGSLIALVPVTFYELVPNDIIFIPVVAAFAVVVVVVIKMTNVVYVQCRIGLVSYLLTVYTFHDAYYAQIGKTCYIFCISWIVSTVLGVVAAVATIFVWDFVKNLLSKKSSAVEA